MEVKSFTLHTLGRFSNLELPLAPLDNLNSNVTVFMGNNGSGKTSILRGLATSLSWFVARVRSESGSGSPIPELVIKNGLHSAAIDINVFEHRYGQVEDGSAKVRDENYFSWRIAKSRKEIGRAHV